MAPSSSLLISQLLGERRLLLDGGLGSQILAKHPTADDFGGTSLEGCMEILCERRPNWIKEIHASYFAAGADAVETNSFGCNAVVLGEFGLAHRIRDLAQLSAKLAKEVAASFAGPRFVIGSVGPGSKLLSLGQVDYRTLFEGTVLQVCGLLEGGADAFLIETCQDLGQVKAAIRGAREAMQRMQREVPLWVQVTIESSGTMLLGSDMAAVITALERMPIDVLGMNCATGPLDMEPHLAALQGASPFHISCLPNAGLPEVVEGKVHYALNPEEFAEQVITLAERYQIGIIGGCCGTTPLHIKALHAKMAKLGPAPHRSINPDPAVSSLYSSLSLSDTPPYYIGERTNANGSKKFRDLLSAEDFEGLVQIAREQESEGAHLLDICVAMVGRNEQHDMQRFIAKLATQARAPLVIDSTDPAVIEIALQGAPGKCVVNSINFEDGEHRAREVLALCRAYGAAVIGLCIDEKGMAKTVAEKVAIAERLVKLVTVDYGIPISDLWIDPLTFTLASGEAEMRGSAIETLEGLRAIKTRWPEVRTLLGLSNVSFGLKPRLRLLINSLMLAEAVRHGLDFAIAHAGKLMPVASIDPELRDLCLDLIYNRANAERKEADPLKCLLARFADDSVVLVNESANDNLPIEEKLRRAIIEGRGKQIVAVVEEARQSYSALEIINRFLLDGMRIVGERFGRGEMQLPFVLESAETMKAAVSALEPYLDKSDGIGQKGSLLLATVKGDVHDIGKNLVDIILTNNGFSVTNLGIKQPIENLLRAIENGAKEGRNYTAIGLSGLLVKSTVIMKNDLEVLEREGCRIPVILGGAALTRRFVEEDCQAVYSAPVFYAADAFEGLRILETLSNKEATPSDLAALRKPEAATNSASGIRVVNRAASQYSINAVGQSTYVEHNLPSPTPPFWGVRTHQLSADELFAWLDEFALTTGRWQLAEASAGAVLIDKYRQKLLSSLSNWQPKAKYGYFSAAAAGDSILIFAAPGSSDPLVKLNFPRQEHGRRLSIADFVRPVSSGVRDVIALQLVTLGREVGDLSGQLFEADAYRDYFLFHGLLTELTEAYAEALHARIRQELGIAALDAPNRRQIFSQGYQGSRYSFGYPACPDLDGNRVLAELLNASELGVELGETAQMQPEMTTSAVVIWHPQARYFSV